METIHKLISGDSDDFEIIYRIHATRRIFQRAIDPDDVISTLLNGTIIENYEEDFPLPSVLISKTEKGKPLHVVVGINNEDQQLIIITAYEPDPNLWSEDYTRRI